jgi:hypothetical protein
LLADQVPRAEEISIDGRVLLFVAGASIAAAILAGALPALRAGRTGLNDALKEGGRSEGAVGIRTRRLLIVCEVALSVVLLMGAGVMLRSLSALRNVDAGFDPHNVLTLQVQLPMRYKTPALLTTFFDSALTRIRMRCRVSRPRRRLTTCRCRAVQCSRSSTRGSRSFFRATSRPSPCGKSRQATSRR